MEVKITEDTQKFKPVTISITFDTPEEVRGWLALMNQQSTLEEIIVTQRNRSPAYFRDADEGIAQQLISWGTVWSPLNELVNPDRA